MADEHRTLQTILVILAPIVCAPRARSWPTGLRTAITTSGRLRLANNGIKLTARR